MRPVTKEDPTDYEFVTVADEKAHNLTYKANSAVAIVYAKKGSKTGPKKVMSVYKTMEELLDKAVKNNTFPNQSSPVNRGAARNGMRKKLEKLYGQARQPLFLMIGEFCSFCEVPLAGYLQAVEHRTPKAPYPMFTVIWSNFLLAERDCNSCKGNRPDRATAKGWTAKVNPTEDELNQAIKDHYYWPDLYNNTYRVISRGYFWDTNAVAKKLTDVEAADFNNALVSFTKDTVKGDVYAGGKMRYKKSVEVQIENNGGGTDGTDTIELVGLQWQDNARSALRTRAWLLITTRLSKVYTPIGKIADGDDKREAWNAVWPLLLSLAVKTGFYSVWVDILKDLGFPADMDDTNLQADTGAQFVWDTDSDNNDDPNEVFMGTNVTSVP